MAGGWGLTITTQVAALSTTTVVTSSSNPSLTGSPVTFTATVTAGVSPVTAGTVQFTDNGASVGAPVAVNGSGQATLNTSALTEGSHLINATYSGTTSFLTSNGSVNQRVNNVTVVTGNTYCNPGALTIPAAGAAVPYPSNILVTGLAGNTAKVTATLNGVAHAVPVDLDVLLVAPNGSNLMLLSDAGGTSGVSSVNVTFDDAAPSTVGAPLASGSYRPTDDDSQAADGAFPAPAPVVGTATALSTFNGSNPNGTWSLYVNDDASGDAGSIANGWCLTITPTSTTTTTVTSSLNPSTFGQSVTFTATVVAGSNPVTEGTVAFTDGATPLGGAISVDPSGQASFTTSALTVGTHTIGAAFTSTGSFSGSSGTVTQVVSQAATTTALTSAMNPSALGQSVTFTATVTAGGTAVAIGTVQFTDGATPLGGPISVDASGQASFTTSTLTVGTHNIGAAYSGTASYGGSSDALTQAVTPFADAGGPYTIAEGDPLTLDGSGSSTGNVAWDLDGDAQFDDATGASPTLTWAQLEALGIDDGPATQLVEIQVTADGQSATSDATVNVTNTAPTSVVTGDLTATVGVPFTLKVGAEDPSSADMAAMFDYTVDWGDGSPVQVVNGPADPPVTHTYAVNGAYVATFTATDKDGGTGGATVVNVQADPPPTTTTTTTTDDHDHHHDNHHRGHDDHFHPGRHDDLGGPYDDICGHFNDEADNVDNTGSTLGCASRLRQQHGRPAQRHDDVADRWCDAPHRRSSSI